MITFGPVPSRRLGRSLGLNILPSKVCTYACIYCQVGPTRSMRIAPQPFIAPEAVCRQVQERLQETDNAGETVDAITIVPDGEPTLDAALGEHLSRLHTFGRTCAVITNASLIWQQDVREQLAQADWVSLKIDAVDEKIWHQINRPHGMLRLAEILKGAREFAAMYDGTLVTETMLVKGINDSEVHMNQLAEYVAQINPRTAYLSIPTRPPSEKWVCPPDEETINRAYQIVASHAEHVELLIGYEGNAFASTGDPVQDLLNITAVHPMREEAVQALLDKTGSDWSVVKNLTKNKSLAKVQYRGETYYTRKTEIQP